MIGRRVMRFLLALLILWLVVGAVVGVSVFLLGTADELAGRTLATVLLLGFFTLTGMGAAVRLQRGLMWLGWFGILVSAAGLAYAELLVWELVPIEGFSDVKPALSLGVGAAALAYVSLLLLARGPFRSVNVVAWITVFLVVALASGLIWLIVTELEPDETLARAFGATAVLTVLGTLVAPLLRVALGMGGRADEPEEPEEGAPRARERGRHRAGAVRGSRPL